MSGNGKLSQLYDFLVAHEATGEPFSLATMADEIGYELSSVRTHVGKKLKNYLMYPVDGTDLWLSDGIASRYSRRTFLDYMSQKSEHVSKSPADRLEESLLERSTDAFILALESYNRPSLKNRVEAFCILMVNAWELLLKAQTVRELGEDALYVKDDPERAVPITALLKRTFKDPRDPIRLNIELLTGLRNDAMHLLLPDIQSTLVEAFQANVINFRNHYEKLTGERLLNLQPGLMNLIVDRTPVKPAVIRQRYGTKTHRHVVKFLEQFARLKEELNSDRFAVSVDHRIVLTRDEKEGDINLTNGPAGRDVEVTVHIDEPHP